MASPAPGATGAPEGCCPPDTLGAASAAMCGETRPLRGSLVKIAIGATAGSAARERDAYVTRPASGGGAFTAGLVVFHDLFGFASGRTHHIADDLAELCGLLVICPAFFDDHGTGDSELKEHTDFRSLSFLFNGKASSTFNRARHPWASVEATLRAAIAWLRSQDQDEDQDGPKEMPLACLGFCWGGWAMTRACGLDPCPFACGAGLHPSPDLQRLQIEGPTLDAALRAVRCPLFLAPAWSDPSYLRPDGWWPAFLNESGRPSASTESILFADQRHGWANRGDVRDPSVKRDVDLVIAKLAEFLNKHLHSARYEADQRVA